MVTLGFSSGVFTIWYLSLNHPSPLQLCRLLSLFLLLPAPITLFECFRSLVSFQRLTFKVIFLWFLVWFLYIPHMNYTMQCLSFSFWLHLGLSLPTPFMLLQMGWVSFDCWVFHCVYIYYIFLIQAPVFGHLGYFYVSAIVISAAMNIRVQVSFLISVFVFFG